MAGLVSGLLPTLAGCALTTHTIEPYRSDAEAAARIEARAAERCRAVRAADQRPPTPTRAFATDGCSAWPDTRATQPCCVEHDIAYWCGGTAARRLAADDAFGACVASRSGRALGAMMRFGVRLGGHPFFPMPYRWGYGDDYVGGYPSGMGEGGSPSDPTSATTTAAPARESRRRRSEPRACPQGVTRSADPSECP